MGRRKEFSMACTGAHNLEMRKIEHATSREYKEWVKHYFSFYFISILSATQYE